MNRVIKNQKIVVCDELRRNSTLYRTTGDGSIIVDVNNYYITDESTLLREDCVMSDVSSESGEERIDCNITSRDQYFLSRFRQASKLWSETFLRIPNRIDRIRNIEPQLNMIGWNDDGIHEKLVLNRKWSSFVKSMKKRRVVVGTELMADPELKSGSLENWLRDLKGNITHLRNYIHFPMIMCERSLDESIERPILDENSHIGKIVQSARFNQTEKSYLELSNMERFGKTSARVDKGDFSRPRLDASDRANLANRGIQAKMYVKKRKSILISKDKSLSPNLDTSSLELYLGRPFDLCERDDAPKFYDIDEGTNCRFAHSWFRALSKIQEFQALEFHDAVLAEVVANSTRNVDEDVFIVRKVCGYRAYVIIKPTSLGSVNDPKPLFYSIIFKGRTLDGIFEEVHNDISGWSYTDFVSTSRIRSSHHMNSMPQFMMMVFENLETLNMLQEEPEMDRIQMIVEPIKWCLLAHLQDKEEFSSNVSNFRYYYFSLFSGFSTCKDEAELLQTKLPCVIRDPLTLLAIRRLIQYHSRIDADYISQQTSVLSAKRIREETSETLGPDDSEYDKLPEVQTPFGFNITNSRSFLKAAYMSIYHNKDEAEKGPAAKQIVSKLCGQEHHMTKLLNSPDRPESHNTDIGESLGIYRFNVHALAIGTDLVKNELLDQCGIPKNDIRRNSGFDEWIENTIIIPTLLRTTYDELSTTRSSYVDNGEVKISAYGKCKKYSSKNEPDKASNLVGRTIKCIEAILDLRNKGVLSGMSPIDDLHNIITHFENDGSKLTIKIFKKNQLTGVREIYILTMTGRLLQRIVEDLARGICDKLHQEKLTGPETKDSFVYEHKMSCSEKSLGKKSVTINGSGDKTQWANYLHSKALTFPLFRIIPEKFHALIAHVGNANTKKEIEIPSALMESMINYPETDLENPVLNEIKNAVLRKEKSYIASYDSSRLRCRGNTMQGICHYMSSLYHMCALMLLSVLIEKHIKELGYDSFISFEVSSDDKGFMVTIFVDEKENLNMLRLTIETTRYMRYLERVIDSAFGIRDSRLKSVTTISVSFEFNSVFYFGNSITTPIAKFTSRCCDDTMQSTLHNRVSSMYSSIRQIRDNGGSGILCSLGTLCQHIVMKSNLGFKRFSWFDSYANDDYNVFKISHTGYRRLCNPLTAGLTMSDFENIKFINANNMGNAYRLLLRRDLDSEDVPEQIALSTIFWARDKHQAMLNRLGLVQHEMTKEESLLILGAPKCPNDMTKKIELMAASGNLSRSFIQCQRSDLLRAGMYLLWHKGFRIGDERVNFRQLIFLLSSLRASEYKITDEYESYIRLESLDRFYTLRARRCRLMPRFFKPLVNHSYVRDDVVKYLRHQWMGEFDKPEQYLIDQITSECTWITLTSDEFFSKYDPIMLHRFINSIPTRKTKMKLLTRGNNHGDNVISCMMRDNTSADETLISKPDSRNNIKVSNLRSAINRVVCKISRWADMLCLATEWCERETYCISDLRKEALLMDVSCKAFCKTRQESLCVYMMSCMKDNKEISTLMCFKLGTSDYLRLNIHRDRKSMYFYAVHLGCPVLIRKHRGVCTDIACQNGEVLNIIRKYPKYSKASINTIDIDYRFHITEIGMMQSSLAVGDQNFMIGGFIGMPIPRLNMENSLIDFERTLDIQSFQCLKFMIECPNEIPDQVYNGIISNKSPVFDALRYRIYMMETQVQYPKVRKSTDTMQDENIPGKEPDVISNIIDNSSRSEFLDYLNMIQNVEADSEGSDDQISDDHDAFIDMYGDDFMRMVPGVDYFESGIKIGPDKINALESLVQAIIQNRGLKVNPMNRYIKDAIRSIDSVVERYDF